MFKKAVLILSLLFAGTFVHAQTADQVYDQYLDFNVARSQGQNAKALLIGESILPNVAKLPAKSQLLYYNSIAKLYEDSSQPEKAIKYYEMVIAAQPDYYVPHLALGYLYFDIANEIAKKLQTAKGDKQLTSEYNAAVQKALPHLEKAQACDPSDETLTLIKKLYANIKDTAGLNSLNSRLAAFSKNCITVLSE